MRILHYSLGFPPYRTGGLTKFCVDLMNQQIAEKHEVSLLWPGEIRLLGKHTTIRKNKSVGDIGNYEIIDPLPVPYDEGIKEFDVFIQDGDKTIYSHFLAELKPDVIHIHTLMGLHKGMLLAAKEQHIRLVFTTHDFFPICPKVTMFRHGKICESIDSCDECGICNNTALSLKKILILQSPIYRKIKDSKVIKAIRKRHRDEYLGDDLNHDNSIMVGSPNDYQKMRKHYQEMLSMMDIVHYNSSVTKEIYEHTFSVSNSRIISISHADIADHRRKKIFPKDQIRIRYLGPYGASKGYYVLKETLDELWKERQDFCLHVHFTPKEIPPYMKTHNRYTYRELETIFSETDVLIAPSIWYETFGYTVLEALSYGVPVIISNTVGSKDILTDGAGIIIDVTSVNAILGKLRTLSQNDLIKMNKIILERQSIMTIEEMATRIQKECYIEE